MVKIKKRIYVLGSIILALTLIGGALLIWDIFSGYGKQQDKVYSGAKLVYSTQEYLLIDNKSNG